MTNLFTHIYIYYIYTVVHEFQHFSTDLICILIYGVWCETPNVKNKGIEKSKLDSNLFLDLLFRHRVLVVLLNREYTLLYTFNTVRKVYLST